MTIRDRIIAACRELAQANGFYSMTMDELAARAGVSKRTLYRYFRSKEDVIRATLEAFLLELEREAQSLLASEENIPVFLTRAIEYISTRGQFILNQKGLDDLRRHYPHLWEMIDSFRAKMVGNMIAALMERENSKAHRSVDSRVVTAVVVASMQAVVNPDFLLKNGITFAEAARQMGKILKGILLSALEANGESDQKPSGPSGRAADSGEICQ